MSTYTNELLPAMFQGAVPVPEEESMTDEGNSVTRFDEMRHRVLQEENARLRDELNEQARINGMGSEREAKLRAALEFFEAYHRATDPVIAVRAREALERE
ncbi:MAG: hypothetical protein ACK52V_12635 [Betaproteobacteria bacterium]|jgi:hypothetical protein